MTLRKRARPRIFLTLTQLDYLEVTFKTGPNHNFNTVEDQDFQLKT